MSVAAPQGSPADATVFIRLVGSVHAALEGESQTSLDLDHVEIGTGSGFVISPYGYVVTNHHVVADDDFVLTRNGRRVKVTLKVSSIDVCFSPEAMTVRTGLPQCSAASVYASDPALDIAVLLVTAPELPYLALGDSDAVVTGLPVDAVGYPLGRRLDIGQSTLAEAVPEVSTTAGTISALRAGDDRERRFLQIDNNLNPGNSGGPLVDRQGYAVGVIRMKLTGTSGIGFAIPINQVKDFLESRGLEQMLPTRRLRLGPPQAIEGKGIRVRFPEGLADVSPFRTHVETDTKTGDILLRIDRIFSAMTIAQIEQVLVGSQTFERMTVNAHESRLLTSGSRRVVGEAFANQEGDARDLSMDYAIVDLGGEKLVARYIGRSPQVAFNRSILRESLIEIAGDPLLTGEVNRAETLGWVTLPQLSLPAPVGWAVEAGGPAPCSSIPRPDTSVTIFSVRDFTTTLRAAVWSAGVPKLDEVVSACASSRGSAGPSSYSSGAELFGVSYVVEGIFMQVGSRLVQLEVVSPNTKAVLAKELLAGWIKRVSISE